MALTIDDLEMVLGSPSQGGYGYLTGRGYGDPEIEARADVLVIARANELGWDRFDLFEWTNSKPARYFAEVAYVAPSLADAALVRDMHAGVGR
jgi:hypothetical protein